MYEMLNSVRSFSSWDTAALRPETDSSARTDNNIRNVRHRCSQAGNVAKSVLATGGLGVTPRVGRLAGTPQDGQVHGVPQAVHPRMGTGGVLATLGTPPTWSNMVNMVTYWSIRYISVNSSKQLGRYNTV